MERQEAQRKVLRIDDQTDETSGGAPQRPSTRNAIAGQRSGGPVPPEQKFAASYQRMKELNDMTRKELAAQNAAPLAVEVPVEVPQPYSSAPAPVQPVVQSQQLQSDLSLLTTVGRIEDEAIIGGFKFKLASLTEGEQNDLALALAAAPKDDIAWIAQLRNQTLARAIRKVNGVPLENLYQGPSEAEGRVMGVIDRRLAVIKTWQLALTVKIFDVYSKILERSEKVFEEVTEKPETLKN